MQFQSRMFVVTQRFRSFQGAIDDLINEIKDGIIPLLEQTAGFRDIYYVNEGGGTLSVIAIFETDEGAQHCVDATSEYVRSNVGSLLPRMREIFGGSVLLHHSKNESPEFKSAGKRTVR